MNTGTVADRFLKIYLPLGAILVYFSGYYYLANYLGFFGVTGGYAKFPLEAIALNAFVVFKTIIICSIDALPIVELACAPKHGEALGFFWPRASFVLALFVLSRVRVRPASFLPIRATRFLKRNFRFLRLHQPTPVLKVTVLFVISVPLIFISLQETAGTIARADAFDLINKNTFSRGSYFHVSKDAFFPKMPESHPLAEYAKKPLAKFREEPLVKVWDDGNIIYFARIYDTNANYISQLLVADDPSGGVILIEQDQMQPIELIEIPRRMTSVLVTFTCELNEKHSYKGSTHTCAEN